MYRTYVGRDGTIHLGPFIGIFQVGDVVDISLNTSGTLMIRICDEPVVLEIVAQGRSAWMLEDLMQRISDEPDEMVRLFASHYLRYLNKLTERTPRRAAYQIKMADAKRVRAYIEVAWEEIKIGRKDNPAVDDMILERKAIAEQREGIADYYAETDRDAD